MAITVDARTAGTTVSNAATASFNHTMGVGSNGILVVYISTVFSSGNEAIASSVVWDDGGTSVAMTNLGVRNYGATSDGLRAEIWYLKAPVTTGTKSIKVTWTNHNAYAGVAASSYFGVNQTTPWNAASPESAIGTSTSPSLATTSANGEMVVSALATEQVGAASVGAGQTQITNETDFNTKLVASDIPSVSASTTTSYTTTSGNNVWIILNGSLVPASSTPAVIPLKITGILSIQGVLSIQG